MTKNVVLQGIEIHCKYDELVDVNELKNHPENPQKHPEEQIEVLTKIFKYQGIRHPIIVSRLSGLIIAGHGRLLTAKKLGMKKFPVNYQDFADKDMEFTFLVSDNAAQQTFAELDLAKINFELQNIGPIDIDLLGIKDFVVEPLDKFEPGTEEEQGRLDEKQMTKCPTCGEVFDHAKNQA